MHVGPLWEDRELHIAFENNVWFYVGEARSVVSGCRLVIHLRQVTNVLLAIQHADHDVSASDIH